MQNAAQTRLSAYPIVDTRSLLRNVYVWMTAGLLLTAGVAFLTASTPLLDHLLSNPFLLWGAIILQLLLVVVLSTAIRRLSLGAAILIFLAYAALTGFTLSSIVLYYSVGTLTQAFLSTAILFGVMTFIGLTTRMDLSKLGTYLLIGLIGLIIASIVNIFLRSSAFDFIISLLGVVIFTGLTAYDTQKIQRMAYDPAFVEQGSAMMGKLSILGALTLYLDFLNLFLYLLRLFGRSDSR